MPRARFLIAAGVILAAVAVMVARWGGPATDTAGDLGGAFGLVDDPPFAIRLTGPLWRDRTLRDDGGALDVAVLSADEPLEATVRGIGGARVAQVELRVDGRVQRRVRPPCPGARCPRTLRLRLTPRLGEASPGDRRIDVVARDSGASSTGADAGSHVSVASLAVRVLPRLPAVVEAETATAAARRPAPGALPAGRRRAALRILADTRRTGSVRALLGTARLSVRAAGALRDGRRVIGATLLLELSPPRRDVSATVPGYVPGTRPGTPYVPRLVSLRAAPLADVLVDVDLRRRRVISVEPGPTSTTISWSPGDPSALERLAADVDTVTDSAAHPPRLVRASDHGPFFLAYDGELGLDPRRRDWPVSLVFAGGASVGKVKDALRRLGFTRTGLSHYLAYRQAGAGLRFDGDRGVKTACDEAATDVHLRLYAPAEADRFRDPELGSVVVASAHLDHNDGCGTGPARFGFSEEAERRIGLLAGGLGWRVQPDRLVLGNAEPYRRDVRDPAHIWLADGRATLIWVA